MQANDKVSPPTGSLAGRWSVWLATGLGLGLVTPAPGTIAGLWGLGLAAAVSLLSPIGLEVGVILVLLVGAVIVCDVAARELGSSGDPGAIVLDEIVALPIVYLAAPEMSWTILLVGYVLFRICDIWKPGLARAAERLPGGLGIVADDAVAAVLAALLLQMLFWVDRQAGYEWLAASA
jgi:phosphatidylglycerophosphatase A